MAQNDQRDWDFFRELLNSAVFQQRYESPTPPREPEVEAPRTRPHIVLRGTAETVKRREPDFKSASELSKYLIEKYGFEKDQFKIKKSGGTIVMHMAKDNKLLEVELGCYYYNIRKDDLTGRLRKAGIIPPRQPKVEPKPLEEDLSDI